MKSINQFAFDAAEQRLQGKMQDNGLERSEQPVRELQASSEGMPLRSRAQTGRASENGGNNVENFEAKEKRGVTDLPKRE
ncbi:hypothetical protein [Desulfatirhabdium butyrativorans]|uniref:hypothetical protein n=1 Tax=Desulfatirhabdium butyrativorans TaxID=340467 RepID=UPI00041B44D6|nr:hypothetical protein [Desulfatirhabdium butyrativorans]